MRKSLPILALLPLLAGCGGGGGASSGPTPARGMATVSVVWPSTESRFVPLSAQSVVVTLSHTGLTPVSKTIIRPAATATFDGLAYTTYDVSITAYPTADASGTAQAKGNAQMTVTEDVPGSANVSLATTVSSIAILPVSINKRQNTQVLVTALDSNGATVLLSTATGSEQVSWTTDAPSIADVAGTGPSATLNGLHSGSTIVRASLSLGTTTATASAPVTINAINDGTGTVTVS